MRMVLDRVDTVIAIDATTERALRQHAPSANVVRIPNCVDVGRMPASGPDRQADGARFIMFLGWMVATKGVRELLAAWSRARRPGWRLRMAGPADARYLADLRRDLDLTDVEFTGELAHDDAMSMLAASDAFVLPSHTEGFPNVVLEAMALAKPIVATRVGAIPEMLTDGCGVLIEPRDEQALCDALGRLMDDAPVRRELGRRARARVVAEYSVESVFTRYLSLWSERRKARSQPAA
jgi:glycosyltransferase involved in cell wall biosynthesis